MGAGVLRIEPGRRVACAALGACATISAVPTSLPPVSDLELLQRIAARDEAALASLYDRHSSLSYGVILRILRNSSDADEVLQETFVRIWTRADTYDSRLGSPAAWLTRIARNRAIDRLRARHVRRNISVEPADLADGSSGLPEPEHHDTPEVVVGDAATTRALREAMAILPDAQRALIEAAFFEGYSHQELAARFDVPLGTVKTRIRSGLTTMRGRLEQLV
jgi:RNA polymerase sigma-70 factor, ECF subfamily